MKNYEENKKKKRKGSRCRELRVCRGEDKRAEGQKGAEEMKIAPL